MKIHVQETSGKGITIPIPNAMLFSPTLLNFGLKIGKRYADTAMPDIPPEAISALCSAIKDIKRKHGDWELVHVESAGGEIVTITL